MYIVIAASTAREVQPCLDLLKSVDKKINRHNVQVLITGVGSIAATYQLTKIISATQPDWILQAGIAGSFTPLQGIGTVVLVSEEIMGDVGVDEKWSFLDIFDLGLMLPNENPFSNKMLVNPFLDSWKELNIPFVRGITINEITTRPHRIEEIKRKFDPAIETMEGAALHYVCIRENIPFVQIRSISNFVGERDKSKWNVQDAITVLNKTVIQMIETL